jgi:hypothetical protein
VGRLAEKAQAAGTAAIVLGRGQPVSADKPPGLIADRDATEGALRSARSEVIRARTCLAIWAAHDGELRQQIRFTGVAAKRVEDALDGVLAQLPPT